MKFNTPDMHFPKFMFEVQFTLVSEKFTFRELKSKKLPILRLGVCKCLPNCNKTILPFVSKTELCEQTS